MLIFIVSIEFSVKMWAVYRHLVTIVAFTDGTCHEYHKIYYLIFTFHVQMLVELGIDFVKVFF